MSEPSEQRESCPDARSPAGHLLVKLLLVATLLGVVAYLGLRSSSYLQYVPWMPRRLGIWADHNGIVRNVVAFFAVAVVTLTLLRVRVALVIGLCVFATAIEVAQIWIPGRVYDPKDIGASIAGVLLAWGVAAAIRRGVAAR